MIGMLVQGRARRFALRGHPYFPIYRIDENQPVDHQVDGIATEKSECPVVGYSGRDGNKVG